MTDAFAVVWQMLQNLLLTVVFETAAALLLGVRKKRDILFVVLINGITNPIINYAMLLVTFALPSGSHSAAYYAVLVVFEILVVIWEYKFYQKRLTYNKINLLLFSLVLNGVSVTLGFVLEPLFRLIKGA